MLKLDRQMCKHDSWIPQFHIIKVYFLEPARNAPLRGNKGKLWEGGTRVPALVYSPVLENTPREYSGLLHVTDWHNTLLAIAGAATLPENDGFNQWEALRTGLAPHPRDSFIYNLDNPDDVPKGAIRYTCFIFLYFPLLSNAGSILALWARKAGIVTTLILEFTAKSCLHNDFPT